MVSTSFIHFMVENIVKIKKIVAREILDSRSNPTIECHLTLDDGFVACASVPSGASVGSEEAFELRDHDPKRFEGMGVLNAINNIENIIAPGLIDTSPDIKTADIFMIDLDGSQNKSKLGANAILAVSMAVARAQAHMQQQELYAFLGDYFNRKPDLPYCMFNIINGGMHAQNGVSFQEFMIMPCFNSVIESVRTASEIYHALKELLHVEGYATTVGDEGGFAPMMTTGGFRSEITLLSILQEAMRKADYHPADGVKICLDVAASAFYNKDQKKYYVADDTFESNFMISFYQALCSTFPIFMIEDGLSEFDRVGWQALTEKLGSKTCLVGDDIFVTNPEKIMMGIQDKIANGVLIKLNQIGTVSEAARALLLAKQHGYTTVVSHRSGETEDSFIADFAVGLAAGYIKAGAPARGERLAKYNRLMEIEQFQI